MARTNTLGLSLPRSAPGYFTALFSSVVIVLQSLALYDPTDAMAQLNINEPSSARFICTRSPPSSSHGECTLEVLMYLAFALIAINSYDLLGALQDNWAIYWFSVVSRIGASALMASLGGGWAGIVPLEFGSAAVLGGCMAF